MAGLTKQHFIRIAKILNGLMWIEDVNLKDRNISEEMIKENHRTIEEITEGLSNYFKTQNPLFNEEQFKKACLK